MIQRLAARMRDEGFRVNRSSRSLVISRIEGEGLVERERIVSPMSSLARSTACVQRPTSTNLDQGGANGVFVGVDRG